ncbi:Zinc finger MYM-type protein 5, partial [Aphis craccivora]
MRRLTPDVFERKLLKNLFCGPCRIFSSIRSQFSDTVSEHEKSISHLNAVRQGRRKGVGKLGTRLGPRALWGP